MDSEDLEKEKQERMSPTRSCKSNLITAGAAKAGVTYKNTSAIEPLVMLRYFDPEVNPNAPAVGDHKKA